MVYIDSCERCSNDCGSGMRVSGLPHHFCGKMMIDYFCPINQGIHTISLKTARERYGYTGKSFDECDVVGDYGKFQDIVETLTMVSVNKPFTTTEYSNGENKWVEFKIGLSEYYVFQVWYAHHTTHNGYFQGVSNRRIVGYCDKIVVSENGEMCGYVGNSEIFKLSENHRDYGAYEGRYSVVFKAFR